MMIGTRLPYLVALLSIGTSVAIAMPVKPGHVEIALVARAVDQVTRRAPIWVGLWMKHDPGWHTYWKNPGDAGMPTRIDWVLPAGWSAGDIEWPSPARIPMGPLASYGYEHEVVLPALLYPNPAWNGKTPVHIIAKASWLVCEEICLPESAQLEMDLPHIAGPRESDTLKRTLDALPQAASFSIATARRESGRLLLTLSPASSGEFFPDREEMVEPGDTPHLEVAGNQIVWSARLGTQGKLLKPPATLRGVWVPTHGRASLVEASLD